MGYKPGDSLLLRSATLRTLVEESPPRTGINADTASTIPQGDLARTLGIGGEDDINYTQCPDFGEPILVKEPWYSSLKKKLGEPE